MVVITVLWRRLDIPGHDACRLEQTEGGWELDGTAVFRFEGSSACVRYEVSCDAEWRTRYGRVRGWTGPQLVDIAIMRAGNGQWKMNDIVVPGFEHCIDLDFGFTPATNLIQLRRLMLRPGAAADVPVAWLDLPAARLEFLPQRYERRSESAYWYQAPAFGYSGLLEVTSEGFAKLYPGLWEMEP